MEGVRSDGTDAGERFAQQGANVWCRCWRTRRSRCCRWELGRFASHEHGCAVGRPDVHDPAEPRQPEETEEHEVDGGGDEPTLKQLTEAWDEEAAKGGENVAAGAGAGHLSYLSVCRSVLFSGVT